MSSRDHLVARLATDDTYRAELVERLRQSAQLLDGTPFQLPEPTRTTVAFQMAFHLRELAQQICDHARVEGGRCRYCEAAVPEGER